MIRATNITVRNDCLQNVAGGPPFRDTPIGSGGSGIRTDHRQTMMTHAMFVEQNVRTRLDEWSVPPKAVGCWLFAALNLRVRRSKR